MLIKPNLHKRVFTARLFSALWSETKKSYGFIPDIIRILKKYSLYNYLEIYLESLQFPSKPTWKKLVSERIHHSENTAWREAMVEKPALIHFRQVHTQLEPLIHWEVARENPFHREKITNLVNLLCGNIPAAIISAVSNQGQYFKCNHCGKLIRDIGKHFVMECPKVNDERNDFYDKLDDIISTQQSCYIHNLDDDDKYDCLLSSKFVRVDEDYDTKSKVLLLVASLIYNVYKKVYIA